MTIQPSQAHNHGESDNNGKCGYFLSDDSNDMSYKYILSII